MMNKFWAKDTDRQFMKRIPECFKCVKNCQSHPVSKKREMRAVRCHTRPSKWQP